MSTPTDPAASDFVPTIHHDTYEYVKSVGLAFQGRTILITGASKGIGQAIAVSFARAGCSRIGLLARSTVASTVKKARDAALAAGHTPPDFLEIKADITSVESVRVAASQVQSTFGRIDILINNAGYLEVWKPIGASDPDDWWRAWEVNIKGTYLIARAFLPLVLASQQKTMVTMSSAGAWFTLSGASAYEGTKTAQVRFNNHLQHEYGDQGLLVFSIHPGAIKTDLSSAMPENLHVMLQDTPELPADTLVWLTQQRLDWLADRYVDVRWDMKEFFSKRDEIVTKDLLKLKLSQY